MVLNLYELVRGYVIIADPPPSYANNGSFYHVHIKPKLLKIYTACVRLDSYCIHNVGSTNCTYDFCPQLKPVIHTIHRKRNNEIYENNMEQ